MSSITANEYRIAAKVDRFHGGQSAAQFYEDNARALESEDLVTQVAMQFAGSTWGGRDAEEQFALAGSERALAYLVGAGRLIPAGGMALTAEQVEDVRLLAASVVKTNRGAAFEARDRLRALFPATEPAEAPCTGNLWCEAPLHAEGCYATHRIPPGRLAPAVPAEEETEAEQPRSIIHSSRTIKTVGEALSYAETALLNAYPDSGQRAHYAEVIAEMLRDIARQRPVGSNGKHGDLHTATCGCEDVPASSPVVEETKAEEWTVRTVEERQALPKGAVIRSLATGLVEERWGDGSWRVSGHAAVLDGSQQSAFPCEVLYPRSRPTSSPVVPAPTETEAGHA